MQNKLNSTLKKHLALFTLTLFLSLNLTSNMHNLKYLQGQVPEDTACWLPAIGRSAGRLAENKNNCKQNEEFFKAKCFLKCPKDFIPKGFLCWAECKEEYEQCGAICIKNQVCSGRIKDYVENIGEIVEKFVEENGILGEIDFEKFSDEFAFAKCK